MHFFQIDNSCFARRIMLYYELLLIYCLSEADTYMKVEMHTHTSETSPCAHICAQDVIKMYKEAGYDTVVITDHYSKWVFEKNGAKTPDEVTSHFLKGYKTALGCAETYDINVLLGCEVTLTESPNDYLLYGVNEDFFHTHPFLYNLSLEELSEICHNENILIVQAHPNRAYCEPVNPALLDGAEVFNGNPRHDSNNDKTYAWAYEHDLIMTSGSDFHEKEDLALGGIITEYDIKTENDLIQTLLSGDYSLITPVE